MHNPNRAGAAGHAAAWQDGSSLATYRQHTDLSDLQPPRLDPADRLVLAVCVVLALLLPVLLALEGGVR